MNSILLHSDHVFQHVCAFVFSISIFCLLAASDARQHLSPSWTREPSSSVTSICSTRRTMAATVPTPFFVNPAKASESDFLWGVWSTFLVTIGTPYQIFQVGVSTGSLTSWTFLPGGCEGLPPDCPERRGAITVYGDQNVGFQGNESSTFTPYGNFGPGNESIFGTGLEYGASFRPTGSYFSDVIALQANNSAELVNTSTLFTGTDSSHVFWMGQIGLGVGLVDFDGAKRPSMIDALATASQIPSRSWAYSAGAQYRQCPLAR